MSFLSACAPACPPPAPSPPQGAVLTIQAGAGGTDAQDWAEMLERMYCRWAEKQGHAYRITDRQQGERLGGGREPSRGWRRARSRHALIRA